MNAYLILRIGRFCIRKDASCYSEWYRRDGEYTSVISS